VECPCCGGSFARWVPHSWGGVGFCPNCRSHERHRTLWLFLQRRTNLLTSEISLLHFAPEPILRSHFSGMANLAYTTADLRPGAADLRSDITDLPCPDDSFDLIICSHVLEHVDDDRLAIREMLRVLRPGGSALVLIPADASRSKTYEDLAITTPEGRLRAFNQEDHLRVYGSDFPDRLEAEGFDVSVIRFVDTLDDSAVRRYGLLHQDEIFVAVKPFAMGKPAPAPPRFAVGPDGSNPV
jgi:SAM-dependent methyltransferase